MEVSTYVPPVPCRVLDIERSVIYHGAGTLSSCAWAKVEAAASRHRMIIFIYCILNYACRLV